MKIKYAIKVIQQIGQFKNTSFTTGRSTMHTINCCLKINRLKEEQEHTLPSIAYLNPFNHLEQEINKMKKLPKKKMKNRQ